MTTITEVAIQSFMGIDEATFPVVDGVNVVAGANGSGKTSAVAAVLWALAGRRGAVDQPIKIGAAQATVRVFAVGEYEFEVVRTQTGDKADLKVKRDGAPIASPQKALDAMIGALAFDPIEFASMKPADQVKTLLEAFDADIDLDKLDAAYADLAAARVAVGRDMRIMWIQAGSLLDDASLAEIRALADEHGLQVFIERVGSAPGAIELRGGYLAEVV